MRFLGGFAIGFIVGFPTSLIVLPSIRKIVNKLTAE
jgi:gas vesicle protein